MLIFYLRQSSAQAAELGTFQGTEPNKYGKAGKVLLNGPAYNPKVCQTTVEGLLCL